MTRGRFYATAMPIYALLYIGAILAFDHQSKVASIGALGFAIIAVLGAAIPDPEDDAAPGPRRDRRRNRGRKDL